MWWLLRNDFMNHTEKRLPGKASGVKEWSRWSLESPVIYDLIYFLTRTGQVGRTWKDYCFTAHQTTLCLPFQSMRLPELKVLKETQDILIGDLLCLNNREVIRVISAVEQLSVRHRKDLCYKETENADFMFFFIIFVTWTCPFYSFFFSHLFFPS